MQATLPKLKANFGNYEVWGDESRTDKTVSERAYVETSKLVMRLCAICCRPLTCQMTTAFAERHTQR